ncbi:MAG: GvpL/GvpF family gas vesicle protein [Deltaproteobacteria bacterium]|nr:GvpL/GvpF family gas vesicle protein [Deltaproteobacteria bacterium]
MGTEQPITGLWVYCVIENKGAIPPDIRGIHGTSPVISVACGDFALVVSEEPMKKYPLMRDTLIAHQLVNEKVLQTQPVLPVRFCTMATNAEQIIEQVLKSEERTVEFRKALIEIRGKNEYGFRARWKNLEQVFANLPNENEKLRVAKENILKLPSPERRGALIEIGHIVKEALEEKNKAVAESMIRELAPYAFRNKKNNVLGDMNILNAAFLVEEKRQQEFDAAVNALVAKQESDIQFKYIGPIPPFNFIEIVIRWDNDVKKEL